MSCHWKCHACPRAFKESRGLSQHVARCLAAHREQEEEVKRVSARPPKRARHDAHDNSLLALNPGQGSNDTGTTPVTDTADTNTLPEPESPPASISFSGRRRKVPRALKDYIPHSLVGLPSHLRPAPAKPTPPAELDDLSSVPTPDPDPGPDDDDIFTTEPNGFGLY